eukprot:m.907050 g.907050  ORF g.907050 m.907050 type:complete len:377 (-) comp23711_c0_seq2:118-1248(-)
MCVCSVAMYVLTAVMVTVVQSALPPGPGPFGNSILPQPVQGAQRGASLQGWKAGKICDVSAEPYLAKNGSNATAQLQQAIDDCGDLDSGGTVLIPSGLVLQTASLFLRSNLTFRVESGSTLIGTTLTADAPMVYTRRNCLMVTAHAGILNGGRCVRLKDPLVGWDDCAEWTKLTNVVLEGGGTIDANGEHWYAKGADNFRPCMLDLLWIDGLTIRDLSIRRPGYWTVHPTFSNNVRVTNNSIITTGPNTDGCDPDSTWNVYIADNTFSTGDDCIAIKAGRDWSGRMVNISTQNVLAERNVYLYHSATMDPEFSPPSRPHMTHIRGGQTHHVSCCKGVSIGSETSGWVRNVTIRDSRVQFMPLLDVTAQDTLEWTAP